MSPVWVKLGDFGASKWIQDPSTTALRTQVSTPLYGAPEVQGLDSNSETSIYTNAVDIWSLGCVIYELLMGRKLFASWDQVKSYCFGKWPFPEHSLRGLSPPTDDAGISLLKCMLSIDPRDRPTAAEALDHVWLAGLTSGNEHSGGDYCETTPIRNESTPSRKPKDGLVPHDKSKERRSERDPPTQSDTRCTPGDVDSAVNQGSQAGSKSTTLEAMIDTPVITR